MKKYLKFTLMALAMILMGLSAQAQSSNSGNQQRRASRQQFAETQAKHIATSLALDDATTERFMKTYMQQQQEVWALGPRLGKGKAGTEAETGDAIQARFERSQKLLNLREKYYKEYSKFLTQKQIQRMYEIERQTMQTLKARRGGRGHRGGK